VSPAQTTTIVHETEPEVGRAEYVMIEADAIAQPAVFAADELME
jgi:hypothetical protein